MLLYLLIKRGGRVQRLNLPNWKPFPPAQKYGTLYESNQKSAIRAAWLGARLIAHDLHELGISINCIPTLDLFVENTSDVIGDRALIP